MRIDAIKVGIDPPEDVNVIIEVPIGGEPIKYEMDKAAGTLVVDRFLHTPMRYPGNYGFVPHTLSEDGDPIDVLVANTRPIVPGAVINVRPIGVLRMVDDAGGGPRPRAGATPRRPKGSSAKRSVEQPCAEGINPLVKSTGRGPQNLSPLPAAVVTMHTPIGCAILKPLVRGARQDRAQGAIGSS
jgi:hypothetical protein